MSAASPGEPPVVVESRGHTLTITINRPAARNALNAEVARLVADAADRLDEDPALRVGILTGAGGTFSAGMDLRAFAEGETPFIARRGLCGLTTTPPRKPLVAAVEGWALAGGLELLLACDVVVAAEGAQLGVPEVRRGLVAAAGGALLLPRSLPRHLASELLLTGDAISARRAHEIGLVNRVVPDGDALSVAHQLADRIASNGPLAIRLTKEIIRSSEDWGPSGWEEQAVIADRALASEDAREGAAAFAERRMPRWRDR